MNIDPLVKEVRVHRSAILESFGGDFEKMYRDAMRRQWLSGHKVVSRGPRKTAVGIAPNAYPLRPKA